MKAAFVKTAFAQEIRDVRPPVDLPPNYFWLYLIGTLLAAAALFWAVRFIVRYFRVQRVAAGRKIFSPWETALEALHQLEAENLPRQGKAKEYYTRLSDILRRYIEERFNIRAPEMTTEEFLRQLNTRDVLTSEYKEDLKNFLNYSDMVKFAKYSATQQEMRKSLELAKKFIEETKPAPVSRNS